MADEKKPGVDNLRPFNVRTEEEQRAIATMGGKASGEARARKKTLRQELESLLSKEIETKDRAGNIIKVTTQEQMTAAIIKKAMLGSEKAFEVIRDTIGEKPVERVITAEIPLEKISEIENLVFQKGAAADGESEDCGEGADS